MNLEKEYEKEFEGKNVMITGGLGFIGSNLTRRICELNTERIVVIDYPKLFPELGGDYYNIKGLEKRVKIYEGDIGNRELMRHLIEEDIEPDFIFNLVGSIDHKFSKEHPVKDIDINLRSHVAFLQTLRDSFERRNYKRIKIVYTGTRDQYGKVSEENLPVNEEYHKRKHSDAQGIHKEATEHHHLLAKEYGVDAVSLRLTNTYGIRHPMKRAGQGFFNWFIKQAILGNEIPLYDGGKFLRDFNYVGDVVDAMIMTMSSEKTNGQIYNLGAGLRSNGLMNPIGENVKTIGEVAKKIIEIAETGSCKSIPYPEDQKSIEPGHFWADISKINQDIGWSPKTSLEEGIRRTIEFYRQTENFEHYLR